MSDKPKALYLAEVLENAIGPSFTRSEREAIATELRRLHAENEALRAENTKLHGWIECEAQAAGTLQRRLNKAEDQRDELLAALHLCRRQLSALSFKDNNITHALERANSAIIKVEEQK